MKHVFIINPNAGKQDSRQKIYDMADVLREKHGLDVECILTRKQGHATELARRLCESGEELRFYACGGDGTVNEVANGMIPGMKAKPENMLKAAGEGFINATDLADYLVKKGMPFRTAYKHVGEIVAYCIKENLVLDTLPIEKYKEFSDIFDNDLYSEISLETCVSKRISEGGTGLASIEKQIDFIKDFLKA